MGFQNSFQGFQPFVRLLHKDCRICERLGFYPNTSAQIEGSFSCVCWDTTARTLFESEACSKGRDEEAGLGDIGVLRLREPNKGPARRSLVSRGQSPVTMSADILKPRNSSRCWISRKSLRSSLKKASLLHSSRTLKSGTQIRFLSSRQTQAELVSSDSGRDDPSSGFEARTARA